jgi:hypothetical protein
MLKPVTLKLPAMKYDYKFSENAAAQRFEFPEKFNSPEINSFGIDFPDYYPENKVLQRNSPREFFPP